MAAQLSCSDSPAKDESAFSRITQASQATRPLTMAPMRLMRWREHPDWSPKPGEWRDGSWHDWGLGGIPISRLSSVRPAQISLLCHCSGVSRSPKVGDVDQQFSTAWTEFSGALAGPQKKTFGDAYSGQTRARLRVIGWERGLSVVGRFDSGSGKERSCACLFARLSVARLRARGRLGGRGGDRGGGRVGGTWKLNDVAGAAKAGIGLGQFRSAA
ncbi:hypothetical protein BDV10DRAFT_44594 [Aspergillus recurvatus]